MSNLSDLLPAGAGGKQVSFVASGTIGNGVTVGLNSDGTVTAVQETNYPSGAETAVHFSNSRSNEPTAVYDANSGKIVIAYGDIGNSAYGTAIVGTISNGVISFGTPVVFISSSTEYCSGTYDETAQKTVISFSDNGAGGHGKSVVGTVSGTTISFGSVTTFRAGTSTDYVASTYDAQSQKIVIAYRGGSTYGTAIVGTVSGTSISFGTEVQFETAASRNFSLTYDSNAQKTVIFYAGTSNYGRAIVGTVSGTSISFGTAVVFNSATTYQKASAYDPNAQKIAVIYYATVGVAKVGTVSGTSISFGSQVSFNAFIPVSFTATYDSNAQKIVVSVQSYGGAYHGYAYVATISGTSISFTSETQITTYGRYAIYVNGAAFDSINKRTVFAYDTVSYGDAIVWTTAYTGSNNTDFIGISDAAISDTASGSVTIKGGISTNVTGLTPNSTYYVQADGSLSTTASDVLAGKALSSTSINLDYTT